MNPKRPFFIKAALLLAPAFILLSMIFDLFSEPTPYIGGGGYDLGPAIYSFVLIAYCAIWTMVMLCYAIFDTNELAQRYNRILVIVGIVSFITLWQVFDF